MISDLFQDVTHQWGSKFVAAVAPDPTGSEEPRQKADPHALVLLEKLECVYGMSRSPV